MSEEQARGEDRRDARQGPLVVVMGVSGSGKSTVGELLAERLDVPYAEADSFHPPANIRKMAAGTPLDDEDRRPWLDAIARWLSERAGQGGVVSCSALRRRYRDRLRDSGAPLFFLHLDGSEELIAGRLKERKGHFMPRSLLRSQFATLEPLEPDEQGAAVPIGGTPAEVTERALAVLAP
jgi:gluconokinase